MLERPKMQRGLGSHRPAYPSRSMGDRVLVGMSGGSPGVLLPAFHVSPAQRVVVGRTAPELCLEQVEGGQQGLQDQTAGRAPPAAQVLRILKQTPQLPTPGLRRGRRRGGEGAQQL